MDKQQIMSPSPLEDPPAAPLCAHDKATSVSVELSQASEHGASDHGVERLDRMERLIGNLMSDIARNAWSVLNRLHRGNKIPRIERSERLQPVLRCLTTTI